ncbi:histamine N-methyltransferase-like [Glandiceps talaboti]
MATTAWLTLLADDLDWYDQAFKVYQTKTKRHTKTLTACSDFLPKIILENHRCAGTQVNDTSVFRYLGVGSGAGMPDITLLEQLQKSFRSIKATIVDPNPALTEKFKQNLTENSCHLPGVTFDFKLMTFEEYMSVSEDEMFDCIVGINSLYHVDNPDETVRWLHSKLNDSGTLIFQVTSVNNSFPVLWSKFPVLLSTRLRKVTPDLIEASLKRSNAKDIKVITLEADVDVTECFDEDSNEGSLLLDFMTQAVRFRTTAPPILVRDVLQFMSEKGVRNGNQNYVSNNYDFILARR